MIILFWIIGATLLVSAGALIGVIALSMNEHILRSILLKLIAFSSGALLGGAFFHLLPEGIESLNPKIFFGLVLCAIVLYLFVEKVLHWHHCHDKKCDVHMVGYMNLFGDGIHNFIDGLIIAAAFLINVPLGITTTIAIALHEIPQEIGDFGVLIYAGFSKARALIYNFAVALLIVVGGIVGWVLSSVAEGFVAYLVPIAAGGFIYIAVSDLIPELRNKTNIKEFGVNFIIMLAGIGLMLLIKII